SINQRGSQRTTNLDYEAKTSGGHNPLQDLRVGARVEDQFIPHQDLVRQIWPSRMDDSDTYASGLKIDKMLRGNLNSWHTLADLNLPVGALTPGQTWKLNPKQVFLDYLYGFDPEQNCILQGDYLGSYRKDNQQIGVVRLQGEITDGRGNNKPVGRIAGLALLDGNNRRVLEVIIRCDVSKQVSGTTMLDPTSSIEGFMQLRLQNADS
ncbi:MAG TPA: hypothetical protein PKA06_14800, partial [Gemmatales bacterium]|nr:hypothetical protein [Gemmatales bacterium]